MREHEADLESLSEGIMRPMYPVESSVSTEQGVMLQSTVFVQIINNRMFVTTLFLIVCPGRGSMQWCSIVN